MTHSLLHGGKRYLIGGVIAAIGSVAAVVALVMVFSSRPNNETTPQQAFGNTSKLAELIDGHQAVWQGEAKPAQGDQLEAGSYSLASGAAQLQFANGAQLLIQAPSEFSLVNQQQATLQSGSLSLFVPPAATGFRVTTPKATVVDHGTRIGIACSINDGLEVHVFEGRAETVGLGETSGTMLNAGEAIKIDKDSRDQIRMVASRTHFLRSIDDLKRLPIVSGDVELRVSPPLSVRRVASELVDVGRATVFAEQQAVELPSKTNVFLNASGSSTSLQLADASIPAGTRVDSFMVHFAVPRNKRRGEEFVLASGEIRFQQPILGVIAFQPKLYDELLGIPTTNYPKDKGAGLEDTIDGQSDRGDQLELSEDRLTLSFRLQIHGRKAAEQADFVDQFRILVESDAAEISQPIAE